LRIFLNVGFYPVLHIFLDKKIPPAFRNSTPDHTTPAIDSVSIYLIHTSKFPIPQKHMGIKIKKAPAFTKGF